MIDKLQISNFKSIRALELACSRVNVFIGAPNAGKSNILEALGLLSYCYHGWSGGDLHTFVRYEQTANLFYEGDLSEEVRIQTDNSPLKITFERSFIGRYFPTTDGEGKQILSGDYSNLQGSDRIADCEQFKFYRYEPLYQYGSSEQRYLLPPHGSNLLALLLTNRKWYAEANRLFEPSGLHLRLRPADKTIEVERLDEARAIPIPYSLTSDTLLRFVVHDLAMKSNTESVLIFEEPEAHAFPAYTKYLAERIALDGNGNQFFIATHNPYLLEPLLEKCPQRELAVMGVTYEEHATKARRLSKSDVTLLLEGDPFFQLDTVLHAKTER